MLRWCSCPSTYIALNGRAGHRFSHAPQPMQRASLTTGMRGDRSSPSTDGTIVIAPDGQWRAQLPHFTPSVSGTQFLLIHTAWPICVADLSAAEIGKIAPAGQTSEQRVHSGRQYPRSYDITGCINVVRVDEGRSTPLGHSDMQSWQLVQRAARFRALSEPGGVMGVSLPGATLSSMTASPPSTFFFSCAKAAVAAMAVARRNERRPLSAGVLSPYLVSPSGECLPFPFAVLPPLACE